MKSLVNVGEEVITKLLRGVDDWGTNKALAPKPEAPTVNQPGRLKVYDEAQAKTIATRQRAVTGGLKGGNKFNIPDRGDVLVRSKDAKTGRLAVEDVGTKVKSDGTRKVRATPKGEEEAAAINKLKRKAAKQNDSLMHQTVAGRRKSIVEHDVALRAGGDNERLSISDPFFKDFKDAIEQKIYKKFGDKGKYIVTIDDVSGGVRIIRRDAYDKYKKPSEQKGVTIEPGEDIDRALKRL
jgi:hypothetical protein